MAGKDAWQPACTGVCGQVCGCQVEERGHQERPQGTCSSGVHHQNFGVMRARMLEHVCTPNVYINSSNIAILCLYSSLPCLLLLSCCVTILTTPVLCKRSNSTNKRSASRSLSSSDMPAHGSGALEGLSWPVMGSSY